MKRIFTILLKVLVFVALILAAFWSFERTYDLGLPFQSDYEGAGWRDIAALVVALLASAGLLACAFLPFLRSQRELPFFFRAHFFVPILFALWVVAGSLFPFSCRQLTQSLPGFLLGANDWGVGNIYTYTKLADWIALLAGCAACARLKPDGASTANGIAKRTRLCFPHLLAGVVLHGLPLFDPRNPLSVDLALLFGWALVGFAAVVALQSLAESSRRRWPTVLSWLASFGWIFVSVARFRP